MNTLEQAKFQIFIQHGKVKGLKQQAKVFKTAINEGRLELEDKVDSARKENLVMGSFDDCGSFYENQLNRANGELDGFLLQGNALTAMLKTIKHEFLQLKALKQSFLENFGQAELELLEQEIQTLGVARQKEFLQKQKSLV